MANLVYRVLSPCCILGYGFPAESLEMALRGRIDAIVCDAGSVDAGPCYLGTGAAYFPRHKVKEDVTRIVAAAARIGCPVIVGSAGIGGGDRNVAAVLDIFREVFVQLNIREARVATISAELDPECVIREFRTGSLRPLGAGLELSEAILQDSTLVGQMGVHPIISALDSGAQYVIAGRACDASLYAADMIRKEIDAGLAYHVGHVLECGAIACEPGSPSDSLVAEIYDDQSALFVAPNAQRRCTVYSIAAHSLYEEPHPQLQFYPEGVLSTQKTEYFARSAGVAGIRGSTFTGHAGSMSVKLEGARRIGGRKISLIYIDPADLPKVPADVLVYGRNGVQLTGDVDPAREMGVIIETTGSTESLALMLATAIRTHLCHAGYPGRKGSAGNLAHPLSPNAVTFKRDAGNYGAVIPAGTSDPRFFSHLRRIEATALAAVESEAPHLLAFAQHVITPIDASNPVILLATVDADPQLLSQRHERQLEEISRLVRAKPGSLVNLDAPDAYSWSLFHLLQNQQLIRKTLFPITHYEVKGGEWVMLGTEQPRYTGIGIVGRGEALPDPSVSLIADVSPPANSVGTQRLIDMVAVIRAKNAGVNRLTFDLVFNSGENYEAALLSNVFSQRNVARVLGLPVEAVVGTYFVDACNAIKITIERPVVSADPGDRDLYGEQQQGMLESLEIPVFAGMLNIPSSF